MNNLNRLAVAVGIPALRVMARYLNWACMEARPQWIHKTKPMVGKVERKLTMFLVRCAGHHRDGVQWWVWRDGMERPGF